MAKEPRDGPDGRSEARPAFALEVDRRPLDWEPLLRGGSAERAALALDELGGALCEPRAAVLAHTVNATTQALPTASLSGGSAGLAIFHAYFARARTGSHHRQAALRFLDAAVEAVGQATLSADLYGGITGVAWTLAHLEGRLFDPEGEDLTEAIDDALVRCIARSPWTGDYDLVNGLVGIGVYAVERLPRIRAHSLLELVIDRLAETAERRTDGVTWFTPPALLPSAQKELAPKGYYNVGLAHGVPAVVALLGAACAWGVAQERAEPLLADAVAWLLAQRLPPQASSCFPRWLAPRERLVPTRSAWCYGDPGVAAALLVAARCVEEPDWEREALTIARRCARRPAAETGVRDAGLCHGAAGLGHVFNRLFQATGDELLRDAACFWLARALDFRKPGQGVAGFQSWMVEGGDVKWQDDPGLLTGAAGIGLALLAATTDVTPEWDRMMLLSVAGQT